MSGIAIPGFGLRREAREDALVALYEAEISGRSIRETLADKVIAPSGYAVELVHGVRHELAGLDEVLQRHLVGWTVDRLAVVDRILARMAVWELLRSPGVPAGVVLSEAVALATHYCGPESPRFLNGLLGAIADEVRSDTAS